MMKKPLIYLFLFFAVFSHAQSVGINSNNPRATLDVVGSPLDVTKSDGIIAPRITLAQLNAKTSYAAAQTASLIYVNDITGPTGVTTALVTTVGYYFFDGTIWQSVLQKSAVFTASLGTGSGSQINATIAAGGFNTVPLNVTKNVGGGVWSGAPNYTYNVPITGTYIIKSSIRLTDGSASRNIFQSVGTSNTDVPEGIWQTNPAPVGTARWTMLYTRIAFFTKGDLLRLYIYSDGAIANLSDASLNIALLNQN
ncbi:hypothetical protein [Halpernia frigidisoli]|uniref:C1q domain-containing protein n=1 Tax=Halpernia frigidisoli TaxID=1125876 RepID=A0A1I3I4H6_9FLAO|nr:hypothetical protein [Halpernia frigidisoli]SFI42693.1 hypothetical protein SAMN05443292_2549 [Halpernia frigidisoli]